MLRRLLTITVVMTALACTTTATASITAQAEPNDGSVSVRGSTDLPDGAQLRVWGFNAETAGSGDPMSLLLPGLPVVADVANGGFRVDLDSSQWPRGTATIVVSFDVNEGQPSTVVEAFGANGERLEGPQVREDTDGYRILETTVDVTI